MIFLEKISELNRLGNSRLHIGKNAVFVDIPDNNVFHAKHIVFSPMSERLINHLIQSYKETVPESLLTLYRGMNGA